MKLSFFSNSVLILLVFADLRSAQKCESTEYSKIHIDIAMDLLKKAKDSFPSDFDIELARPEDCNDLLHSGHNMSGIYTIWPRNRVMEGRPLEVYCDMDTDGGGWTLIQRRGNFGRSTDFFYKDWASYKEGFGDLDKDFWLGNDNIFAISNQKQYVARFDLKDVEGSKRYAQYDFFWIDDENHKYMLHIRDYKGDAGDSMYPRHDKQKFSTKDKKNDSWKSGDCAVSFKGAWWYADCHDSNLNGLYLRGKHESQANGINWKTWKGHKESLEETEIKLRPKESKTTKCTTKPENGNGNNTSDI